MIYMRKIISKKLLFLKIFYVYLILLANIQNVFSIEINYNIFFSNDNMFLENENGINSYPYSIKITNLDYIELIQGPKICKYIFTVNRNNLEIKDPNEKLKTYVECTLLLNNFAKQNQHIYKFGVNRTFKSWCLFKNYANIGVQKTIDAIMDLVQVSNCFDQHIQESLNTAKMINLSGKRLNDLSPLGSLISLRALWLDDNELSNLKPISSLKNLIVLSLSNNQISDTQVLKNLRNLKWLFLSENLIEKIDSLSFLEQIKLLSIKNNYILNVKPLFQINKNALIFANGNPFQKNVCREINEKKYYQNYDWIKNLCKG